MFQRILTKIGQRPIRTTCSVVAIVGNGVILRDISKIEPKSNAERELHADVAATSSYLMVIGVFLAVIP